MKKLKSNEVKLGIRSEFIQIAQGQAENVIKTSVKRVEDFGNFKLLTTQIGKFTIKTKVSREVEVPAESIELFFPVDKCCIYFENKLI